jgi:hypothetical protein
MFRALVAHLQEALHKQHKISSTPVLVQPTDSRRIPSAVCEAATENEQVMVETCRGPYFLINLIKKYISLVSLYWS